MGKDQKKETPKPPYSTIKSHSQSTTEVDATVDDIDFTQLEESWEESSSDVYNFDFSSPTFIIPTTTKPPNIPPAPFQKLLEYEKKICELEEKLNQPIQKQNLTEKTCNLFTNLESVELVDKLHDVIAPLVPRKVRLPPENQEKQEFVTTPKNTGRKRKLPPKDEFLLTLMKLRLNLQRTDLFVRFDVSEGLCSNIFKLWLQTMAEYFKAFVFIPDLEVILATTPDRFCQFKNLVGTVDYSEVFIETPKNLELQSATWSEYKHHNTIKCLVCVAPNSSIIYISECYIGHISDKALTKVSSFSDELRS